MYYVDYRSARKQEAQQIGRYILLVERSHLFQFGYDSVRYKNVELLFNDDLTFSINQEVPFFANSAGRWKVRGPGGPHSGIIYLDSEGAFFEVCCENDSVFYISDPAPKAEQQRLARVYFKKIGRK